MRRNEDEKPSKDAGTADMAPSETYKTKRKLVDVIEISSKFPNAVATIFAYVSLAAVSRSLPASVVTVRETYRAVAERRTRIGFFEMAARRYRQTPRARNRPDEERTERERRTGDRRKRGEWRKERTGRTGRIGRIGRTGREQGEGRARAEEADEIWAVLEGVPAYPIGYASVTATFTMSGYTRPRTSLGRTFSYTCIQVVSASTIPETPAIRTPCTVHPLAATPHAPLFFFVRVPRLYVRTLEFFPAKRTAGQECGIRARTVAHDRSKSMDAIAFPTRTQLYIPALFLADKCFLPALRRAQVECIGTLGIQRKTGITVSKADSINANRLCSRDTRCSSRVNARAPVIALKYHVLSIQRQDFSGGFQPG